MGFLRSFLGFAQPSLVQPGMVPGVNGITPFAPTSPAEGGATPQFAVGPAAAPYGTAPYGTAPYGKNNTMAPNAPQGQIQGGGWLQRLNRGITEAPNTPLFNIGMGLMAAGSQPGGDMSLFANHMMNFNQQQMQRQQLENDQRRQKASDIRDNRVFERQETAWGREDEQRLAWQAAVANERDPSRQAMLRAVGPDGYGQFMAQEAQQRFQADQANLDRRNALNVAGMRLTGANRPEGASRYWQRPSNRDQMLLQDYEGAAQNARSAMRGLDRLERLFGEMIQRDAQGRPLPASTRMTMSRLMQTNPEARAAYEQIQSQVWPMVLQNLEGLAPVTEVELGQALARTVNADMTPESAMAEIRRMREESQYALDLSLRAFDFTNEAGSLNTGRNEAGQNWIEYSGQIARPEVQTGGQSNAPAAPRIGEVRNGYRYTGGDPSLQSSWVRVQQRNPGQLSRDNNGGNLR